MEKAKDMVPAHCCHTFGRYCARETKPIYCREQISNWFAKEFDAKTAATKVPCWTSMRMGYDFRFGHLGPGQH
jgi:hypothetical protein